MLKLKSTVSVVAAQRVITGRIVGIDQYSLENVRNGGYSWPSYTLTSERKDVFSRYWITDWARAGWILWTRSNKKKPPAKSKVVFERSGIAHIEFTGDHGGSTPYAALIVSELEDKSYYAMERFTGSETMFFVGRKIRKPTVG